MVKVSLGAVFGALGVLGAMFRRDCPFPLQDVFLGSIRVCWLLESLCLSPGGDGEQLSVGGPF